MYAIIVSGGKQFRVEEGKEIKVAKLAVEPGSEVTIDKVLLLADQAVQVGAPYVAAAKVTCEVMGHGRDKKVVVFHKWRRNDSRKKQGHRQDFTTLRVKSIVK